MKELYLILDDEPLDRRSIMIVESKSQAESLIKHKKYWSYEIVYTLSDEDIKEIICDERLSTMDNAVEFVNAHCIDCDVSYDVECPYK